MGKPPDRRRTWQPSNNRRKTRSRAGTKSKRPSANKTTEDDNRRQQTRQQPAAHPRVRQQYEQDEQARKARRVSVLNKPGLPGPGGQQQRGGPSQPPQRRPALGLTSSVAQQTGIGRWFTVLIKQGGIRRLRQRFVMDLREYKSSSATTHAFQANGDLNRYEDVPCIDATRVHLQKPPDSNGNGGTDYIHANHVTGAAFPIICAQGPINESIERFWIMVLEQNCQIIVQLCQFIEEGKEKCANYLPTTTNPTRTFGMMTVRLVEKTKAMVANPSIRRTRLVVCCPSDGRRLEVFHLLYDAWPDHSVPFSSTSYRQLRTYVQKLALEKKCTVLVHCSAGIGRTGTYAAVEIAIYQLVQRDSECQISVLLRALRNQRASAVQTDLQYLFIHRAVLDAAIEAKLLPAAAVRDFNEEYETLIERKRKERKALLDARNVRPQQPSPQHQQQQQ